MWSSTSQLFQHRINQSTARKIIHTWTHELATPGTPLGADPNTSLHESAKKKRKKENVKINDFESEFCTAKTAFNEKSLIQLWIMVVETWWFQWLCGLQTMTELWLLYIKEWLKIVLKNCNGQRATIWNIEANAGRNGKGKNLKILRKKYTFYPTKVRWEDLKLIIFGVK